MYKHNLQALLKTKDKAKFNSLCKQRNITKRDLFVEALIDFQKMLEKQKDYNFKYQEISRIKDESFVITVFDKTHLEMKELSQKLNTSVVRLAREIVSWYVE